MFLISKILVFFCVFFTLFDSALTENGFKIVKIKQGLVRGFESDDGSIFQFFGIPYATAPSGDDKFKAPLPPPTWNYTLNATIRDIICPQLLNNQIPEKHNMSFDCLKLNVFTPKGYVDSLPVVLYIHGGAFKQGYGNELSPKDLVKKGIIVVNFNYRVGAYGFLCLGTEFAPGNAALKDQVAALKWIRDNIIQFGGDPNNVSVAGNSAGGTMVEMLMLSKMASGLFHKALSESGNALPSWAIDDAPIKTADYYASHFNFTLKENITALENFYKSLTIDDFRVPYDSYKYDVLGFVPCIEKEIEGVEAFLIDTPINIIESGDYNRVPYVTGITSMEGIYFLQVYDETKEAMEENMSLYIPRDLEFPSDDAKNEALKKIYNFYFPNGIDYGNYVKFWTDTAFAYALVKSTKLHKKHINNIFLYMFTFDGSVRLPKPERPQIRGPGHVVQAMYVQNFSYGVGYDEMNENDFLIKERMLAMWSNFYKYGKPIIEKDDLLPTEWLTFSDNENYLNINVELKLKSKLINERFEFWDELYAKYRKK